MAATTRGHGPGPRATGLFQKWSRVFGMKPDRKIESQGKFSRWGLLRTMSDFQNGDDTSKAKTKAIDDDRDHDHEDHEDEARPHSIEIIYEKNRFVFRATVWSGLSLAAVLGALIALLQALGVFDR